MGPHSDDGSDRTGRPSISIAMCTYNGIPYLDEQLESIARQTVAPTEMIVCDDRSSDSTVELLESFAKRADFPVHISLNPENLGSNRNFDQTIAACTGDVIVLADQDDVWLPNKLERIMEVFCAHPRVGAVFSDAEVVDSKLQLLHLRLWKAVGFTRAQQRSLMHGHAADVMLKHGVVTGCTMAFRAEHKCLVLPIPPTWNHDAWISLLIALASDLAVVPEPLILYRQHSKNQSGIKSVGPGSRRPAPPNFRARLMSRVVKYEAAYARITSPEHSGKVPDEIVSKLIRKLEHLKARSEICGRGWDRIPIALREALTLRYHFFSKQDRAVVFDLLRTR